MAAAYTKKTLRATAEGGAARRAHEEYLTNRYINYRVDVLVVRAHDTR